MYTKYGELPIELLDDYKHRLIGKIFKILPMKEEDCATWEVYIDSLLFELIGNRNLVKELKYNSDFLALVGTLKNLKYEEDLKVIKREVFKCIDLLKKL